MQQSLTSTKDYNSQSGIFLIELALVMLVVGFAIVVSIPLYNSYVQRNALIETNKRIDFIAKAISSYSQVRFRVPCPANPTPVAGTQYGLERVSCRLGAPSLRHGIIPYRTLGIPEQYAKDAYGNFFTYVVSPSFTVDNRLTNPPKQVHLRLAHLVADNNYALLPKANFCAPIDFLPADINTDITVIQDGNPLITQPRDSNPIAASVVRTIGPDPNSSRTVGGNVVSNRDINVTAVAVAIISHGENRNGAYQSSGAQSPASPVGTAEQITSNNANNTVETEFQTSQGGGANDYDDIVKFYTQDEIYAQSGNNSCEYL